MKKFKFLFFLPLLFATSLHAAELYTTAVQKGLSDMLNPSGKFTTLRFSDGTSQSSAGLTSFILGTNTTGILPITQGGTGTNTATLDGFAHTGTSTFPSGVWGNTGNVGIGTTTPTTELHVIGTVTATDFSGNGSQLTGISSGEVGSWTSVGGLLYPKTISDNVGVGTTTPVTTLQVIGTVTASGFSGNGAGLTGISATVAFSAVTGSATASQLPLISGLLGSATSSQLPVVIRLPGTTTEQAAGAFGQLYVQSSMGVGGNDGFVKLLLKMENPGTSTFVDISGSAHTVTAVNNAIGTTTAKFGSGGGWFDGTTDRLTVAYHTDHDLVGTGTDFTLEAQIKTSSTANTSAGILSRRNAGQSDAANGGWIMLLYEGKIHFAANIGSWLHGSSTYYGTTDLRDGNWHHVAIVRTGNTYKGFADGVQEFSVVNTNTLSTPAVALAIADNANNGEAATEFNGVIDEVRISKGIARWTGNFTPPIAAYLQGYTQYSAKYADPVNGNTVFEILTTGTASTEASYIYNNATTTVFGLGTNTAIIATSTAYSGWFDGAVRATAFNVASTEKIKENIKPIRIKPDLLDAEGLAKNNYINTQKTVWITDNIDNYTYVGTSTPSGTITTYVDNVVMERDYDNYIELAWASDLNQDTYTENIQKTYEKGFWQMFDSVTPKSWNPQNQPTLTRKGFVVEDMPDVVKGDDGQSLDPMALIAYISLVQQTFKADTIFALNTMKELITTGTVTQSKIDYCNDRLEVLNP